MGSLSAKTYEQIPVCSAPVLAGSSSSQSLLSPWMYFGAVAGGRTGLCMLSYTVASSLFQGGWCKSSLFPSSILFARRGGMFESHHSSDPNPEQVHPCTGARDAAVRAAQTVWWYPFSLGLTELQGHLFLTELWDLQL